MNRVDTKQVETAKKLCNTRTIYKYKLQMQYSEKYNLAPYIYLYSS